MARPKRRTVETPTHSAQKLEIDGSDNAGNCIYLSGNATFRGFTVNNCGGYGIWVTGEGNSVLENYVGSDPTGTVEKPNNRDGVLVIRARDSTIGDTDAGNLIFGNGSNGVRIVDSDNNELDGNVITQNHGDGVYIHVPFPESAGTFTTSGNSIASSNPSTPTAVPGSASTNGANAGILPPAIAGINPVSGTACPGCTVNLFADLEDEGQTFLSTAVADVAGNWEAPSAQGPFVTATATDAQHNTSEFSPAVAVPTLAFWGNLDCDQAASPAATTRLSCAKYSRRPPSPRTNRAPTSARRRYRHPGGRPATRLG